MSADKKEVKAGRSDDGLVFTDEDGKVYHDVRALIGWYDYTCAKCDLSGNCPAEDGLIECKQEYFRTVKP